MSRLSVAVVVVVHGRHEHLTRQHAALGRSTRAIDDLVVVSMSDVTVDRWEPGAAPRPHVVRLDADPGALPLARARNVGADVARRLGADLLVFLDVDCLPAPDLLQAYADADAAYPDALLCGPVAYLPPPPPQGYPQEGLEDLAPPHPGRPAPLPGEVVVDADRHELFWSLSFALRTRTWDRIGGFDEAYVGYGGEDTDFGRRAHEAGIPLAWVGGARAFHQHHPVSRPPVEHVGDIVRNAGIFHRRWGTWPMTTWLSELEACGLVHRDPDGTFVEAAAR